VVTPRILPGRPHSPTWQCPILAGLAEAGADDTWPRLHRQG